MGYPGENQGDYPVHEPVRKAAEALTFGADLVGEDFADVDPDDRALGKREEGDEADQQPDQQVLMLMSEEDVGYAAEAGCGAHRAHQEECFSADLVDHGHGDHGEQEICGADGYRLQVAGNLAEARGDKDVVDVVEDGVDAGELVEHADGNGEENREAIVPGEKGVARGMFGVDGLDDVLQFFFVIFLTDGAQDFAGFLDAFLLDQPAGAARNPEQ